MPSAGAELPASAPCSLAVELLDELVFGLLAAAWRLIRTDFDLGYAEIGLLMSVPALVSTLVDPVIGVAGDAGHRRALVVGGAGFALAGFATGLAPTFAVLLLALVAFFPASTAGRSVRRGLRSSTVTSGRCGKLMLWD